MEKKFQGDNVIVVNCGKVSMYYKNRKEKFYYKHSGYPGALTKTSWDQMMDKDPAFPLKNCITKMLHPNQTRKETIEEKVKLFVEPYHTYAHVGLPQFIEQAPPDVS